MKKTLMSAAVLAATMSNVEAGTLDFLDDWNKSNFYMGLLLSNTDIAGETGIGLDMGTLNATFGYSFPKGIGLEVRAGIGSDQPDSMFQEPVTSYGAAMFRYHYTWPNNLMVYAAAGASVRTHSDAVEANNTQGGAAFAFGLNLFGSDRTAVNLEYLYMGGESELKSVGIGIQRYFGKF